MSVEIRPLQPSDRAAWSPLWQGYLVFYESADLPAEVTESTWSRLMDPAVDPHGLAAADETGRLVGFVHYLFHRSSWSIAPYCYLEDLYVDPEVRGGGIGKALIEAVYAASDAAGASRLYWLTQHFNARARRLYDHVGELTPFIRYERPKGA
jgi:GNAT superfamily N-acetyltransferase